jgi:hypothetical protein
MVVVAEIKYDLIILMIKNRKSCRLSISSAPHMCKTLSKYMGAKTAQVYVPALFSLGDQIFGCKARDCKIIVVGIRS